MSDGRRPKQGALGRELILEIRSTELRPRDPRGEGSNEERALRMEHSTTSHVLSEWLGKPQKLSSHTDVKKKRDQKGVDYS